MGIMWKSGGAIGCCFLSLSVIFRLMYCSCYMLSSYSDIIPCNSQVIRSARRNEGGLAGHAVILRACRRIHPLTPEWYYPSSKTDLCSD